MKSFEMLMIEEVLPSIYSKNTLGAIALLRKHGKELILGISASTMTVLYTALAMEDKLLVIWLLSNGPNLCGEERFLMLLLRQSIGIYPLSKAYIINDGELAAILHVSINCMIAEFRTQANQSSELREIINRYERAIVKDDFANQFHTRDVFEHARQIYWQVTEELNKNPYYLEQRLQELTSIAEAKYRNTYRGAIENFVSNILTFGRAKRNNDYRPLENGDSPTSKVKAR